MREKFYIMSFALISQGCLQTVGPGSENNNWPENINIPAVEKIPKTFEVHGQKRVMVL